MPCCQVTRVLDEPTAAAIAYGLHQKPNVHHIIVYDFGGGTLDVSLLYVHDGFCTVSATDGDDHLGGAFAAWAGVFRQTEILLYNSRERGDDGRNCPAGSLLWPSPVAAP
jgi:Ethanolamine utilization protein EutJ (predicted chaperonin)